MEDTAWVKDSSASSSKFDQIAVQLKKDSLMV